MSRPMRILITGVIPLKLSSGHKRARRFYQMVKLVNEKLIFRYEKERNSGLLTFKKYEALAREILPEFETGHWHADEKGSNRYYDRGVNILHLIGIPQKNLAHMASEVELEIGEPLQKGSIEERGQKYFIDPRLQKKVAAERDDHYLQAEGRLRANRRLGESLYVVHYDPYAEKFADETIDIADLLSEAELDSLGLTKKSRYATQRANFQKQRNTVSLEAQVQDGKLRARAARLAGLGFRRFTYAWFKVSKSKCQDLKLRDTFLQTQRLYVITDEDVTNIECSPTSEEATFFYNALLNADRALHRNPVFRLYGSLQKDEFETLFGLPPGSVKKKVRKRDLKPYLTLDYTARLTGLSMEPDDDGIVPARYAAIPIPSVSVGNVTYINNYLQGKEILAELEKSITDLPESRVFFIWVRALEDLAEKTHNLDDRVRYLVLHHYSTGKTYFIDLFRILTAGKTDIIQQLQRIFDKSLVAGWDLQQSGALLKAQHNLTISNPYCLKVALDYLSRATGEGFENVKREFMDGLPKAVYSDWKAPRTAIIDRESLVACCAYQENLFKDTVKLFRLNPLLPEECGLITQLGVGDGHFELEMGLLTVIVAAVSAGVDFNGRKHAYFNQIGAITGRLSSVNPNVMGISREERGEVKAKYNYVLLCADYSQIEPRIAASYAGEEALQQVFRDGKDIYREIASSLFHIAPEKVDTQTRSKVKTMFLGLLYGMGGNALQNRLADQGIETTLSEAKELISKFKSTYPKLGGLIDEAGKLAREQKKVSGLVTVHTMTGRSIAIDAATAEESELRAHNFNHIIQGTGADILKRAAVEFHRRVREEGLRAQIVNLIHDEILVEVLREDRDRARELLVDVMETVGREVIGIDTPVECGVGSNWRIAKGE
ncbi:MAG TPA: DNA polymerase A family protein [Mesotoga sp.]|nr:DNA polymerase A family protein [Mesotoga sp.]